MSSYSAGIDSRPPPFSCLRACATLPACCKSLRLSNQLLNHLSVPSGPQNRSQVHGCAGAHTYTPLFCTSASFHALCLTPRWFWLFLLILKTPTYFQNPVQMSLTLWKAHTSLFSQSTWSIAPLNILDSSYLLAFIWLPYLWTRLTASI